MKKEKEQEYTRLLKYEFDCAYVRGWVRHYILQDVVPDKIYNVLSSGDAALRTNNAKSVASQVSSDLDNITAPRAIVLYLSLIFLLLFCWHMTGLASRGWMYSVGVMGVYGVFTTVLRHVIWRLSHVKEYLIELQDELGAIYVGSPKLIAQEVEDDYYRRREEFVTHHLGKMVVVLKPSRMVIYILAILALIDAAAFHAWVVGPLLP